MSNIAPALADATGASTQVIEGALKKALPELKPDTIVPAPLKGLYEVTVGPKVFYVSEDGRYIVQGSLIDLETRSDLTEQRLGAARVNALNKVGLDNMIVFKPKTSKHVVYVFTDIDCGYCRKLHSEMAQYQAEGIEIRYLFFPRSGKNTDSWTKAVSVWCAKDRNVALTKAKKGEAVESKQCENPVEQHMNLGLAMGANGTPMMVTGKGEVIPGYIGAAQLAKLLDKEDHASN
ncbi:DsbC family protein [Methylococcus sp. EFPC2]|nr:DsbC family protein [Methylococcus sp. EFPC2]